MRNARQLPLTETMYYILLSLFEPLHGYGIKKKVEKITKGRVSLSAGTLYGALKNLFNNELISKYGQSEGKTEYIITEKGREVFIEELKRLKLLVADGELIKNLF